MREFTFLSDKGEIFHLNLPVTPRIGDEVVRYVGVSYTVTGRSLTGGGYAYRVRKQ